MIETCDNKREQLITSNIGLAHSCANRFRGKGIEYEDLYQAACVGLVKAADGFDESRGFAFSTYAVPTILGEIRRLFRDGGSVKVGRAMKQKAHTAMREKEKMTWEFGRDPTIGELAGRLGIDPAEVAELINSAQPPISLTIYDDEDSSQLDLPAEDRQEQISDMIALKEIISHFESLDKMLLEMRYFKGWTQSKTAKELGMSQVQVSRREKKLLLEIRKRFAG